MAAWPTSCHDGEAMEDIDEDEFAEFLKNLSVPELAMLAFELRKYPEDKKHLDRVLGVIAERGKQQLN